MRVFLIILSILIFRQSVTVCMPSMINASTKVVSKASCTHACCKMTHKKESKDNSSSQNDDHKCKCSSCKVLSTMPAYSFKHEIHSCTVTISTRNTVKPVQIHSYDFHDKISYPPQV